MIGWIDVLGKLFEFTVDKLADRGLDLAFDKKKRVCKGLLEFYELLSELEQLATTSHDTFAPLVAGQVARLHSRDMRALAQRADAVSAEFLTQLNHLLRALDIAAPELAVLFTKVRQGKGAERLGVSDTFVSASKQELMHRTPSLGFVFQYARPPQSALPDERTAYYARFEQLLDTARAREGEGEAVGWEPRDSAWPVQRQERTLDLLAEALAHIQVVTMQPNDSQTMRQLQVEMAAQRENLRRARSALKHYLGQHFSLADLLYTQHN